MSHELLHQRTAILRAMRRFFEGLDFVEVDTPVLLTAPAPEPSIEAPKVVLRYGGRTETRYLQTSPELPMKRLLAQGLPRIFQLAPAFRDGDHSALHRPEFRILEWYRSGADTCALMDDCEGLLRACASALHTGPTVRFGDRTLQLDTPFRRVTMDEAFRRHAGFSILEALERTVLASQLTRLGVRYGADDSWDDLFHRVFLSRVEPALLADSRPLFLTDYPAPLAALARTRATDARVAERFELYVGGVELANAFGELTDPVEQRRRFERDRALRRALGLADYPLDERFLTSLAQLPPAAGIALGFDRLVMVLTNRHEIDDVAFVPWDGT